MASPSFDVQGSLINTDETILRWLQERWGGGVYVVKRNVAHWSPTWVWNIWGYGMRHFLETILPVVQVKRPAIINALEALRIKQEYQRTKNRLSDPAVAALRICEQRHRDFKLRFRKPESPNEPVVVEPSPATPTKEDMAYSAGFFDAEGCVNIYLHRTLASGREIFKVQCEVGNTNRDILIWHSQRWGGKVYSHKPSNPGWNDCWQWHVFPNDRRLRFLVAIRPFLKIAGHEVDNAIAMLRLKQAHPSRGYAYADAEYRQMRGHYERHRALKARPILRGKKVNGIAVSAPTIQL